MEQLRDDERRKEKVDKMLAYDQMIKSQHPPNPSKKKALEIEMLK